MWKGVWTFQDKGSGRTTMNIWKKHLSELDVSGITILVAGDAVTRSVYSWFDANTNHEEENVGTTCLLDHPRLPTHMISEHLDLGTHNIHASPFPRKTHLSQI